MQWTDEAIETLKRLALEGMSAAAIAAALGAESRNAVIGKASRIGIRLGGGRDSGESRRGGAGHRERSGAFSHSRPRARGAASAFADAEVGEMRRVRFQDIRDFTCKWPLGDPGSGDFAFCGLAPAEGRSYCAGHCRMAYQAPRAHL